MASLLLEILQRFIGPEVLKQSCSSSSEGSSSSSSLNCLLRPLIGAWWWWWGSVSGLRLAELEEEERLDSAEGAGDGGVQKVLNGAEELLEEFGGDGGKTLLL